MEKEKSKISVIVPVFNGKEYLPACINSIESQTYRNTEIIIIDDGSTDGTDGVCRSIQESYDNVKIITLRDEGVSAARNAGIEAAEGEFITFVDADDRLLPGMLRTLYDCITDTGSDIAGCRFFMWADESEWKSFSEKNEEESKTFPTKMFVPDEYIKDALLQGNSRCWSKLYRRSIIAENRFREGLSIGEDMLFLTELLPYVKTIAEMEYFGYGYFQNPHGAIHRSFTPKYMDQITCWELAGEKFFAMNKEQEIQEQTTAVLMMGIMLTVGKLAQLPSEERQKHKRYVQICHEKLKENLPVPGAYRRLSAGYKLKVGLFRYLPGLYLALYHWKKAGIRN